MTDWTYHHIPLADRRVSETLVTGEHDRALVWCRPHVKVRHPPDR